MLFETLTSHPEHDVHSEVVHGVEVFVTAIFHKDRAQTYFFYEFFVDLSAEHGSQDFLVRGSDFLEVLPCFIDDLSGEVTAADI